MKIIPKQLKKIGESKVCIRCIRHSWTNLDEDYRKTRPDWFLFRGIWRHVSCNLIVPFERSKLLFLQVKHMVLKFNLGSFINILHIILRSWRGYWISCKTRCHTSQENNRYGKFTFLECVPITCCRSPSQIILPWVWPFTLIDNGKKSWNLAAICPPSLR